MESKKFNSVEEYLNSFPENIKALLQKLRTAIQQAAPSAEEVISYNMPALRYHGILVYFAAYKEHIGFYPFSSGISAFSDELTVYETSKGTIKFPIKNGIPVTLVRKIVKYRVKENLEKEKRKLERKR